MHRLTIGLTLALLVLLAAPARAQAQTTAKPKAGAAAKPAATPVNLNTATVAELETLPGVGPATAARIVEYRQKNGGFKKIEELMNVRGVGEKSFLKIKDLLTVTPPRTERAGGPDQP
jgi:competence protein ComEA